MSNSLDNLRKTAKRWLRELRSGDAAALERFRRAYRDHQDTSPSLRAVQHALARERGFDSWAALRSAHLADDGTTALLEAASKGDAVRVKELAERFPSAINRRGALSGHTGLRTALHFGVRHEPVVRTLLDHGADPNIRDEGDNAMPLHFAAENQDMAVIRLLVEHGADTVGEGDGHELGVLGWSCCWDYVRTNTAIVEYLLAHGARHTIFTATTLDEAEIIRSLVAATPALLAQRMDRTNKRRTALHLAAIKRQPTALRALLDLGADAEALDAAGLSPLDQAALDGARDLSQILIERGARVRLPAAVALGRTDDIERILREQPGCLAPGQPFGTLIVRAATSSPAEIVRSLLDLGASPNATDAEDTAVDQTHGYTPLHAAAFTGNEGAARVLLGRGADVNARDEKYGGTPAGWAEYAGHRHVRDLILRGPIDIIQSIDFDLTERIPQLLKTDPDARDRAFRGCSPLGWAVLKGNAEAVKFLASEGASLVLSSEAEAAVASDPVRTALRVLANGGRGERPAPPPPADLAATFLEFATWDNDVHGKGDHRMCDRAAARLLAQRPELAVHSLYAAIVCGNLEYVRRALADRPAAATERGGPRGWSPLIYLCFTRFSHQPAIDNAVAIATELLDRGANPNDYYMAGHARYSALTGIAREGEQDAPPHPRRQELFSLLLERGANMYDIQVLYNTHFSGDVLWWLELVYAQAVKLGLVADWQDPNWPMFDMGGYGSGARFLFWIALRKNDAELARWLLAHGANPDPPPARDPRFSKATLYDDAVRAGAADVADLLARHGAPTRLHALDDEAAFVDACLRLDRDSARRLSAAHPEYLRSPVALFRAAEQNRRDVVALLLDLGTSPDVADEHNTRALHHAAVHDARDVARLLIERGAEIDARETRYNAPPIGWASHGDHAAMIDLLSSHTRHVWTLAFRGYVDRLRKVLAADPSLARATSPNGMTPLWWLPDDERSAMAIVELLVAHGADPAARSEQGTTAADWARRRGMVEVARRLER